MKYIIFGIPGVGKTSVVNGVIEKTGIKHIHWGEMTERVAKDLKLIETRDDIRKLNIEQQREIRREVTGQIIKISDEHENVFVETHAAIKTPQGYWPGLSRITLERFSPDVFIVLTASPESIFERRLKDATRWRRDDLSIEAVKEVQNITRQMVVTYTVLSSGTFVEVENKEGDVEHAVKEISDLIISGMHTEDSDLKKKYPFV